MHYAVLHGCFSIVAGGFAIMDVPREFLKCAICICICIYCNIYIAPPCKLTFYLQERGGSRSTARHPRNFVYIRARTTINIGFSAALRSTGAEPAMACLGTRCSYSNITFRKTVASFPAAGSHSSVVASAVAPFFVRSSSPGLKTGPPIPPRRDVITLHFPGLATSRRDK